MRENCTSGSVRGASGNRGSYRKRFLRKSAMATYEPTQEELALIRELEEFRDAVRKWDAAIDSAILQRMRSLINRRLERAEEIVRLAGGLQTLTISPPPAVGGLVMHRVNPFKYI